jgi:putative flippase GtrA
MARSRCAVDRRDSVQSTATPPTPEPLELRRSVIERILVVVPELAKFGLIGGLGFVVDVLVFNVLRFAGSPGLLEHKPLTAKVISAAVATVVTYAGNRHWTWAHRERSGLRREGILFVMFNVVGMAIALVCLAISHYVLDLRSPLADNISANGIGLVLGTAFRFWSYRTYVFRTTALEADDDRVTAIGVT